MKKVLLAAIWALLLAPPVLAQETDMDSSDAPSNTLPNDMGTVPQDETPQSQEEILPPAVETAPDMDAQPNSETTPPDSSVIEPEEPVDNGSSPPESL